MKPEDQKKVPSISALQAELETVLSSFESRVSAIELELFPTVIPSGPAGTNGPNGPDGPNGKRRRLTEIHDELTGLIQQLERKLAALDQKNSDEHVDIYKVTADITKKLQELASFHSRGILGTSPRIVDGGRPEPKVMEIGKTTK